MPRKATRVPACRACRWRTRLTQDVFVLVVDNVEPGPPPRPKASVASTYFYDPEAKACAKLPAGDLSPVGMNYMMVWDSSHGVAFLVTGDRGGTVTVWALKRSGRSTCAAPRRASGSWSRFARSGGTAGKPCGPPHASNRTPMIASTTAIARATQVAGARSGNQRAEQYSGMDPSSSQPRSAKSRCRSPGGRGRPPAPAAMRVRGRCRRSLPVSAGTGTGRHHHRAERPRADRGHRHQHARGSHRRAPSGPAAYLEFRRDVGAQAPADAVQATLQQQPGGGQQQRPRRAHGGSRPGRSFSRP